MSLLQRVFDGTALLPLLLLLVLSLWWHTQNVTHAAVSADDVAKAPTPELPRPLALATRQQRAAFDANANEADGEVEVAVDDSSGGHRQARPRPPVKRTARPTLMDIALEASAREGLHAMAELYGRLELDIMEHGRVLEANHPAALLSKFSAPAEGSEQREMAAYATITATKAFRRNYKNYNDLARQSHAQKISLRRTALEALCPPREPPLCMPAAARYRTHDGTCNNKRHPRWGAAQMPFNRFLPPEYGDGVDSVRDATEGGPLSSSRFVSLLVHGAKDGEAPLTLMTAQWGQLLDHDLTSTAQPRAINGSVPSCCGRKDFHPSCFPIKVPLDDPWLAPLKVRCLEFLRSAPAQRRDCVLSWREQTNQATSYIDASPIYSNSAKSSDNARVFRNGLLVFGRGNPSEDVCQRGAIATQCIRAGDGRSGEQPGLLALHHVWVGEHNRIALQLSQMNPHWSDEKLYQETRRIVGAMFQHITYREFLPIILGREVCKLFDLELLPTGYYSGYNSKVNPTVANSFAAAAFRFGHSLVQNSYMRCDRHHNILSNNVSLHEEFQRGDIGSAGSLHRLIRGLATQRALKRDEFITPELTNHLFQTPGFPFGLDLAAINIQRGRDHGIAPYTAWRVPCGLTAINDWDDFANVVGPESAQRIAHAYRSVHDIDLFVGGIAERPVVGGLVGPTFSCIIAQQFSNSRKGDRFWYENGGFESSFTPAQLHSIRRISLAQVLCRTVGGGTFQPNIFIPADFEGNGRLPCGNGLLAPIDLDPWLEQDPFNADAEDEAETFEPQRPEQVFNIVHHGSIENKASISNRVNASTISPTPNAFLGKLPPTPIPHVPQVNFIPNASSGFQRPNTVSSTIAPQKINDKLDFKRKSQISGNPTARPVKTKPINGISNKLDKKGTRLTLNIKGVNRHRLPTTTRRTVILNNLAVELRTVDSNQNSNNTTNMKKKNSTNTTTTTTATVTKPKSKKKTNTSTKTTSTIEPESRTTEQDIPEKNNSTTELETINDTRLFNDTITIHNDTIDQLDNLNKTSTQTKSVISNLLHISEISLQNDQTNTTKINTTTLTNTTDNVTEPSSNIDPLKIPSSEDHKRVQRDQKPESTSKTKKLINSNPTALIISVNRKPTTNIRNNNNRTRTNTTNINNTLLLQLTKANATSLNTVKTKYNYSPATVRTFYPTEITTNYLRSTTKSPKISKTTKRNVELRQYQTRPIYTRPQAQPPHKVIVDGPNSDQYEIEINIRQTNKGATALRPSTTYPVPSSGYHSANTGNYIDYPTTTPAYLSYYHPSPTTNPPSSVYLSHSKRTKPPTIIYLNEHDERTTTSRPNIFQNFITFASNSFSPSPNNRPQSYKEPLNYETNALVNGIGGGGAHGSPHSSIVYNPRPPSTQTLIPPLTSSFSQVGGISTGGIAHASAVSAGNFGSIVGVASANGADSTFSFNIRPRPEILQTSRPEAGTYGLLPPRKSQSSSYEYSSVPHHAAHVLAQQSLEAPNREELNSPFSTANRPLTSQSLHGYYSRNANSATSERNKQTSPLIEIFDSTQDYDYQGKTAQFNHVKNLTLNVEDETMGIATTEQSDFTDYTDYYEDEDRDSDSDGVTPADRYNIDGYMRPQLMLGTLFKRAEVKERSSLTNVSKLDDNYVLPAMNSPVMPLLHSKDSLQAVLNMLNVTIEGRSTDYPDTFGKQFTNDILAEDDYDEDKEDTTEKISLATKNSIPNSITNRTGTGHNNKIAFAPITLLTKPERPDNWVIYDLPEDKPLLPGIPDVTKKEDLEHTIEVPMPIRRPSTTWLMTEFEKLFSPKIGNISQKELNRNDEKGNSATDNVDFDQTTIKLELDTTTVTEDISTTTELYILADDKTDTTTTRPTLLDITDIS